MASNNTNDNRMNERMEGFGAQRAGSMCNSMRKKGTHRKAALAVTAMVAAAMLALSGCGSGSSSDTSGASSASATADGGMVIGALLPLTGTISYLAPPEEAAIKLAVKDINAAGGVLGKDVTEVEADTSDGEHADQNTSAAQSVLAKHPSVVIGPAASGVVKNVYKSIVAEKIPVISMASTSMTLSGMDPYFFRTVAPDAVQGAVMGNLIAGDGVKKLAIACFNDEYGTGMRDVILEQLKDSGVEVVYGDKDAFDPAETNYASIASAVKNSGADATLVISYDQATPLIKALSSTGVDTHKLYLVDGNTVDYSNTYEPGLLEGSKGTIPGVHVDDAFLEALKGTGVKISDTTYAAETYDAVILAALAAEQGGDVSGETIQKNLASVSGADGGEKCDSFKACKALIKDKKKIQYSGKTGIGAFNKNNDPSSASIGIYEYDKDNVNVFQSMQSGDVPQS
ncbi:receptor family ligand-binding protein [Bifidobacterium gallicum DSM 20093 = LMG 11596]|nr:receptor family ligand-binding protein [Bifidobacterium gallicum DSM 20093 = LMG 11596]